MDSSHPQEHLATLLAEKSDWKQTHHALPGREALQSWLITMLAERLHISPAEIDIHDAFASYGVSSRDAISLAGDLALWLGKKLPANLLYDYPSIDQVTHFLVPPVPQVQERPPSASEIPPASTELIAIVGIGCRFPGG